MKKIGLFVLLFATAGWAQSAITTSALQPTYANAMMATHCHWPESPGFSLTEEK